VRAYTLLRNAALLLRNPTYQKLVKGYLQMAQSNAFKVQSSEVTFESSAHLRAAALAPA
jgi:hypothetical protein